MASNIPTTIGALRAHLRTSIPDPNDQILAERKLLDVLEAVGAPPDDAGGESMGERNGASDMALDTLFRRYQPTRNANSVR
jgi:hypothetical protein